MNFSLIFANFPPTPNRCLLLLPLVLVAISHPAVSAEAKNCVDFTASVSICFTFPFAHCTTANLRQIYREQFVLTIWSCVCKRNILAIVLDCFIQWISSTTHDAKFSQKLIQRRPTTFSLSSNAMQKSRAKLLHPLINSWGSCCFSHFPSAENTKMAKNCTRRENKIRRRRELVWMERMPRNRE